MKIKFVTSNKGKFEEFNRIAKEHNIEIEWVRMEYLEPQGDSLEFVAKKSAEILAGSLDPPFFIEDSGLFIKALKGFPGVYSSYVFKTIGNEGILKLMKGVEDREAKFVCVIAYNDGDVHVFKGEVVGEITHETRGDFGFGYDPIFEYNGRTFAEMGDEKNLVSHRKRAADEFFSWLAKNF